MAGAPWPKPVDRVRLNCGFTNLYLTAIGGLVNALLVAKGKPALFSQNIEHIGGETHLICRIIDDCQRIVLFPLRLNDFPFFPFPMVRNLDQP
jgi:hypothetical protein